MAVPTLQKPLPLQQLLRVQRAWSSTVLPPVRKLLMASECNRPTARFLVFGVIGAGGALCGSMGINTLAHCHATDQVEAEDVRLMMSKICVRPFGVLGTQMRQDKSVVQASSMPDGQTAIVDSGGHHVLNPGGPRRAGGAAKSIYKWIDIADDDGFPPDVVSTLRDKGDAKYHDYGQGRHVIHAFGPDLRKVPDAWDDAVAILGETYCSILREFVDSGLPVLRLLPVSGGIFAGTYIQRMPELTTAALQLGLAKLSAEKRALLMGRHVELCIFAEAEYADFDATFQSPGP